MVRDPVSDNDLDANDVGVRLFKHSPAGIVFDHLGEFFSSYVVTFFSSNQNLGACLMEKNDVWPLLCIIMYHLTYSFGDVSQIGQ